MTTGDSPKKLEAFLEIAREVLSGIEERFSSATPYLIHQQVSWEYHPLPKEIGMKFTGVVRGSSGNTINCHPVIPLKTLSVDFDYIYYEVLNSFEHCWRQNVSL